MEQDFINDLSRKSSDHSINNSIGFIKKQSIRANEDNTEFEYVQKKNALFEFVENPKSMKNSIIFPDDLLHQETAELQSLIDMDLKTIFESILYPDDFRGLVVKVGCFNKKNILEFIHQKSLLSVQENLV